MMRRLLESANELNIRSARLIMHGTQVSCVVLLLGIVMYLCNDTSINYSLTITDWCRLAIVNAVVMFAEFLIGGLFLDYYQKRHGMQ